MPAQSSRQEKHRAGFFAVVGDDRAGLRSAWCEGFWLLGLMISGRSETEPGRVERGAREYIATEGRPTRDCQMCYWRVNQGSRASPGVAEPTTVGDGPLWSVWGSEIAEKQRYR